MEHHQEVLLQQLDSLAGRFSRLGAQFSQAARELRDPEISAWEGVAEEISTSWRDFADPCTRILGLAESLMDPLLRVVARAEEQRLAVEQVHQSALGVLDRVLAISHINRRDFPPLSECQAHARELLRTIAEARGTDSFPDLQALAEGQHPFAALLTLIEHRDSLDDEQWKLLQDVVALSLGKPLAMAASRGQLSLGEERRPETPSTSIWEERRPEIPSTSTAPSDEDRSPVQPLEPVIPPATIGPSFGKPLAAAALEEQLSLVEERRPEIPSTSTAPGDEDRSFVEPLEPATPPEEELDLWLRWEQQTQRQRTLAVLSGLILLLLPLLLWLGWMKATFSGLSTSEALDYAQLARHLFRGEGFVTSVLLPLSLAFVPHLEAHPNLFHPPLFPLWEALWFRLGGARPTMAALASGTAWIITVWLVYALAARLFNRKVGFLAVALFVVNLTALRFSVSGLPPLLTATLLMGVLWTLAGLRTKEAEAVASLEEAEAVASLEEASVPVGFPWGRLIASAVLVGLTMLSDYSLTWPLMGGVALFWILWPRWAGIAYGVEIPPLPLLGRAWILDLGLRLENNLPLHVAGVFAVGVLLPVAPWLIHNYWTTDRPCFSVTRYDLLTQTKRYPGQSVYRRFNHSLPEPGRFALEHPGEVALKGWKGLRQLGREVGPLANWVVLALFLVGCVATPGGNTGRVQRTFLGVLLVQVGLWCVTSQRFTGLVAFVPGMTVWAAGAAYRLLNWLIPSPDTQEADWDLSSPGMDRSGFDPLSRRQFLLLGVLWVLALLPLVANRPRPSSTSRPTPSANVAYLKENTRASQVVMTDDPWLVAWYGDRPALWLVQEEQKELAFLEQRFGQSLAWLYFSRYWRQLRPDEVADWWLTAMESPQGYKTFLPHPSQATGEVLLKHYPYLREEE